MPSQSNDAIIARLDAIALRMDAQDRRMDRYNERIEEIEKKHGDSIQWANNEHTRIHEEITKQGEKIRNDLIQEGKDMRLELQDDIKEIKQMVAKRDSDKRLAYLTIGCVFLSGIVTFVMYVILHATHVI